MRKMISLVFVIFAAGVLLQGCYTIVDLPEISYEEYSFAPDPIYQPAPPIYPIPIPAPPRPPHHPHPPVIGPIISGPPVTITNPPQDKRKGDIQKIRDDGNGRGNSGRNTDFNKSSETRTETNNNSSTNNDNTRRSSNAGNSGNTRR
jgi:hypothetical protein